MNIQQQGTPSPLEHRILALVQVYKVVTADQVAENLHITWEQAYKALLRLHFVFSVVNIVAKGKPVTEFHIVERRKP